MGINWPQKWWRIKQALPGTVIESRRSWHTDVRHGAKRIGWASGRLVSEINENEVVTYVSGFDHTDVEPGEIVQIADEDRAGVRLGGRILSRNGRILTLDADVAFPP